MSAILSYMYVAFGCYGAQLSENLGVTSNGYEAAELSSDQVKYIPNDVPMPSTRLSYRTRIRSLRFTTGGPPPAELPP